MDEFKQSRFLRRIALLAAISCSASAIYAAESKGKSRASFQDLIAQGWKNNPPDESASKPDHSGTRPSPIASEQVSAADNISTQQISSLTTDTEQESGTLQKLLTESAIANPVPQSLQPEPLAPESLPNHATPNKVNRETGLAELIRARAQLIHVPKAIPVPAAINDLESIAKPERQVAEPNSMAAEATFASPVPVVASQPMDDAKSADSQVSDEASSRVAALTANDSRFPIAVPKSLEELNPDVASQQTEPQHSEIASSAADLPESATAPSVAAVSILPGKPKNVESLPAEPSLTSEPSASEPKPSEMIVDEVGTQPRGLEPSGVVATQRGAALLPIANVQPDPPIRFQANENPTSPATNAQAIRLRQAARQSLASAKQRLARGATHSAKMFAMQALRSIVAMQDALHGGNGHTVRLNVALDAIRESRDFNGTFGPIDQDAMQRMVAIHKTTILKDSDLENLSASTASESYLNIAGVNLLAAAGGATEAGAALVILGKAERGQATMGNAHAFAVAMMMQDAAVRITPNSGFAHYELATTQMEQGLIQQAAHSLKQSVSLRPTRCGYEKLLEVSRQCGDIDTVRSCQVALKSDHLQTDIPVQVVAPERFASTHRPVSYSTSGKQAKVNQTASTGSKDPVVKPTRISLRSIIPFGRR